MENRKVRDDLQELWAGFPKARGGSLSQDMRTPKSVIDPSRNLHDA
jgi:hypothetical protein